MSDVERNVERDARISELIAQRRAVASGRIKRATSSDPAPLSTVQLSLWLEEALQPTKRVTARPTAMRLIGQLDRNALRTALERLLWRHEPLRTVYPLVGAEPVQQVVQTPTVELGIRDVSGMDDRARASTLNEVIVAAKQLGDPAEAIGFNATLVVESHDSHVLVVGLGHICFDGWSEVIFRADLLELYRSEVHHVDPLLPELKIRFTDYARWERAQTSADRRANDLVYWREAHAGIGQAPALPPAADAGGDVSLVTSALDGVDMAAVRLLARDESTTPFVVLLTAFQLVIRDLTDAEDFLVSCPAAGRDRSEVYDLISCFINPLFVRSGFRDVATRSDLLRATRVAVAGALAHTAVPAREVAQQFGSWTLRPRVSRISFQWRDFPQRSPHDSNPLKLEAVRVPVQRSALDVFVTPTGDGADLEVEFNPSLLGPDSVSDLCARFVDQIRELCSEPTSAIGPLRPAAGAPDPALDLSPEPIERVAAAIKRQRDANPAAGAIESPAGALTYDELWDRSGVLASRLLDAGVVSGDFVAVLSHRNAGHVAALLGVMRAGAVVVPIDAGLPPGRIELMASTAKVSAVVVVDKCAALEDVDPSSSIHLDELGRLQGPGTESMRRIDIDPAKDAAYVFFTSGTSGTPKAVLGTHLGLSHFVTWERSRIGVTPDDRVAGITGTSFDVSLREVFLPLTSGACLVIAPETIAPDQGLGWLTSSTSTIAHITPSLASAWLSDDAAQTRGIALRWTLFAGEPLLDSLVDRWADVCVPTARVMNLYGPTETCLVRSAFEVGPHPRPGVQPVGYSLPYSQLLVVAHGESRLCEPGEPGEVYIRTAVGTAGYVGEDLGGFVENPLVSSSVCGLGELVYRTGDVGWYEPDWSVTVQGRLDDQVKIDGVRIEPAEVESFLSKHPGVRRCLVLPVDYQGMKRLEAFVVPRGDSPHASDLRKYLSQWLRPSAIPPVFHAIDKIPLTSNNKVDRRALLRGAAEDPSERRSAASGKGRVASAVRRSWTEVLGIGQVEGETDFFATGGTSLRALRILARIKADLGTSPSIDIFFDHPTFDQFVAAVESQFGDSPTAGTAHSPTDQVSADGAPLSFMQEAMWAHSLSEPGSLLYVLNRVFDIRGTLDTAALRAAVGAATGRHEALRTQLAIVDGDPVAYVGPVDLVALETVDLDSVAGADRGRLLGDRVEACQREPFDLATGPLVRFVLFTAGDDHHRLVVRGHHMILDGWSLRILMDELGALYQQQVDGLAPQLPTLTMQYADYARRQRDRDRGGEFDSALAYWTEVLADPLPEFSISGAERPPDLAPSEGHAFDIDSDFAESMDSLSRSLRVTPFMLGLSLWSAFLCAKSGEPEVVVGVPVADRGWAPSTSMVGLFLNTVAIRVEGGAHPTLEELTRATRGRALQAFRHSEVPLERVLEVVADEHRRSRRPIFRVMFQYHHDQDNLADSLSLEGLVVERLTNLTGGTAADLYLTVKHNTGGLTTGRLRYDPRTVSETDAADLATEFLAFARAAVAEPDSPLPELEPFQLAGPQPEPIEVPLSYAQERMWFVEQLDPGTADYVLPVVRRVDGPINTDALERALAGVVQRHGVLRTRVTSFEGQPRAYVDPPGPVPLLVHDLRPEATEAAAAKLIGELSRVTFDLNDGGLVRGSAIRLDDEQWLLAFTFHHIVMDAGSFGPFFRDLGAMYAAELSDETASLGALDTQYWDFAKHQRDQATAGGFEKSLEFWEQALSPPLPRMTVGTPHPGGEQHVAVVARRVLPDALLKQLRARAAELHATPYMLSLAIWAAVLCDETGQDEVLTTMVATDRSWSGTEDLVGYFVNTLPLRMRADPEASLADLVRSVRAAVLGVYGNAEVPLDLILDRVRPFGATAGSLVNGVEISLQDADALGPDLALPAVSVSRYACDIASMKFDLQLGLNLGGRVQSVVAKGRASLMRQTDVDRLLDRFVDTVSACLDDPDRPVRSQSRKDFSHTSELVPDRFRAVAQADPELVVIEHPDQDLTASEFNTLASSIADSLLELNVRPGDLVVLAAKRSPLTIAAMYGCWRVGAAYVPVDVDQPAGRTQAIINDCAPAAVLSDGSITELRGMAVVDLATAASRTVSSDVQAAVLSADDAAYVIYTSGSTGRPKGVVVSHGAVAAFAEGAVSAYGLRSDDRTLQFHSLAFDGSVEEVHVSLARGVTLVLPDDDLLGSASRFLDYVAHKRLTAVSIPTAFWHELVNQAVEAGLTIPACLRVLIIGGEAARPGTVEAWHTLASSTRLVNSYGPTETTVVVLAGELSPGPVGDVVSVGFPLPRVKAAVLGPSGAPVADRDWGELVIGGPQLAIGYLGLDNETASRFVFDGDGQRWYHTGDRARLRPTGEVEVSGRFDDQVKIAGHRIEPGEVERVLRSNRAVAEACVVAVRGPDDSVTLLAAVVLAEGYSSDVVVDAARQDLPSWMVPGRFSFVDRLPTTPGGKVDRGELRASAETTVEVEAGSTSQAVGVGSSATVDALTSLWCELLELADVAPDADFFELGGRSLTAVRLSYLIETEFGISLPIADIFETPTISELSVRIEAEGGRSGRVQMPSEGEPEMATDGAWPRSPVRLYLDRAPLSFSQQRIWLHQELRDDRSGYMIRSGHRLRGPLDTEVLQEAVAHVIEANEVLRTRFVVGPEGRPSQHVDPAGVTGGHASWTLHDLRQMAPRDRRVRSGQIQAEFVEPGFDLAVDHPFRLLVIAVGPAEHLVTVVVHHIAVDGDGLKLLMAQIGDAYQSGLAGKSSSEPTVSLQFGDFAVWQRARLRAGFETDAVEYWREHLAGIHNAFEVPGRRSKPSDGVVEDVRVDFSESVATGLGALADQSGASSFQLLLAMLNVLFHRLTGSEDIVLGTPSSERRSAELGDMIGLFVNTLVLRSAVAPTDTFAQVLRDARACVGSALDHSGVPFDALIDELRVRRDPDRLPLLSVLCLAGEEGEDISLALPDVDVERMEVPPGGAGAVAELLVHSRRDTDGRFGVSFRYDTGVLDRWVVRQMGRALEVMAAALVADPAAPVGTLPIIEAAEEAWLATGVNDTSRSYPEGTRVEATFAEVAAQNVDRVAVVDQRRQVTYGGLRDEVAAFAATLSALGSGPGSAVGVRLDRSVELAVAMLAVLQTGAVYVPIDAQSPDGRSREAMDQAGVAVVVTAGTDFSLRAEATGREAVELPQREGEQPAYVMFTSGSTGQPKGVVISHRAIQRTVQNIDYTTLGPGEVVAMASNPAFDALTFEVWGALLTGARLEIVDTDTLTRPAEFAAWLRGSGVTTMFLTTSLANLTVAGAPDAFCTLDTLIVGGEAVDVGTMASLLETGPRRLVNGYGPTECTTFSVCHEVTELGADATSVPIGGPTANTRLYVLDSAGALVPQGFDGELCIAGPGLSMGYVGDAELTAKRFVTVSIAGEDVRVYRTGDLVRRDAEGVIFYLGRLDHQIKLRGFRIELGEIEAALSQGPGVARAAAQVFGEGSKRRLIGFVVGAGETPVDLTAVRNSAVDLIPAYMVPAQLVELDALPLTESGKIDRRALVEPLTEVAIGDDEPVDEVGQAILTAWRQALQLPGLGLDADFFENGGNSLLGVEMLASIERRLAIDLRLSTLFEARTPRQLALLVREKTPTIGEHYPDPDHVITLRSGNSDSPPLWLIHPAGGSLVLYEPMVRHLSEHRRMLGVEASGLDGASQPLSSVEELADHQFAAVLKAQPHGPYRILGYSIGGVVGLELARRLISRGERVELLGAIEAGVPNGPHVVGSRRERYGPLLKRGNLLGVFRLLRGSLGERRRVGDERRQIARNQLDRAHKAVLDNMVHAFEHFEPTPLDIDMILFFGDETAEETAQRLRDRWSELATGHVSIRRVSGSHDDDSVLREPHAAVLAQAVEDALDACDRGAWS